MTMMIEFTNTVIELNAAMNEWTELTQKSKQRQSAIESNILSVPDHDGGRPMEVNACILITHMVYL